MATLLFTALGNQLGGPLGGAIGALAGRQVDTMLFGGRGREGPRLKELAASTSSYGAALPRLHGRMRSPGAIIWATDLVEHREKQGGGKGRPSVTSYSYSASFAVALASRPIRSLGRIWADGNLLRGAGGDLKTGGTLRLHTGEHDQLPDPLIAVAEGASRCPAFRGLAYAVFENLDLSDFGNRIPALTFEVFADEGPLTLAMLTEGLLDRADTDVPLPGLAGIGNEGPLGDLLATLDPVYPMDADACGERLTIARERLQASPIALAEAATSPREGDFGAATGFRRTRVPAPEAVPELLRYYDVDRDYQPGLQRAPGRPRPGQPAAIELPAAMAAADARRLIASTARRAGWARETFAWRSATLDPAVAPGAVVTVPGEPGRWRVTDWEWRETGVELTLARIAPAEVAGDPAASDPGRAALAPDLVAGPTRLAAFELPWDGQGSADTVALFAAASSASAGWSGAALYVDQGDGELHPVGVTGRARAVLGTAENILPPASPMLFDRSSALIVELAGDDMALTSASPAQLAMGENRALLGGEVIQFARAEPLGGRRWRLTHLLRRRGGSESSAASHVAGETFVLLDGTPVALDAAVAGTSPAATIAAIGRGDAAAVHAAIANRGVTLRPLSPVHPRTAQSPDGGLTLGWTRRARGAWTWNDGVDVPLQEQSEVYEVFYGPAESPVARWETSAPRLDLTGAQLAAVAAAMPAGQFHVRQRGSHALSEPLFLYQLT